MSRRAAAAAAPAVVLLAGIGGLAISVAGLKVPVPAGIGIDPAVGFAPLHTHRDSVHPHLCGRFTRTCVGGSCAAGDRRLRVDVNGTAYRGDPTTLPLASHQEILVAYGTACSCRPPSRPPAGSHPASSLAMRSRPVWACRSAWVSLDP